VHYLRYSGDPGDKGPDYDMVGAVDGPAGSRLSKINCLASKEDCMDAVTAHDLFYNVRSRAKINGDKCAERISRAADPDERYECFDNYCLFDVQRDPCEYRNVAKQNGQALAMMVDMLEQYKTEMIRQNIPRVDPNADPRLYDGYWDTWMERGTGVDTFRGGHHARVTMIIIACVFSFAMLS